MDIYHNTVYFYGNDEDAYTVGMMLYNQGSSYMDTMNIKNNQFIAEGKSYSMAFPNDLSILHNYPIYIDANNYYVEGDTNLLQEYQRMRPGHDLHSVSIKPIFVDSLQNTDIVNFEDYMVLNVGIGEDIQGTPRYYKTAMGAYTPKITDFTKKMGMVGFVGLNGNDIEKELCAPDYRSIKVAVTNKGYIAIDFSATPMTITLEVSGGITATVAATINSGVLEMGETDTVEITNMLDVRNGLAFDLKAYLTCSADTINVADDTTYLSVGQQKFNLPIDETFVSGLPNTLKIIGNNSTDTWRVIGNKNNVIPQFGGKMLAFDGTRGAESKLFTTSIDLSNTFNPILEFWYYHDTSSNVATGKFADGTEVVYTIDGGLTFKPLLKLYKNNGVDIKVLFNAMRMSSSEYDGEQYIDRIHVFASQDMAIAELLVNEMTTCNQTSDIKVVIENKNGQVIDFDMYPTTIQLDVISDTAHNQFTYPLSSGRLNSFAKDTLTLTNNLLFGKGNHTLVARIVPSIDAIAINDTLSYRFTIDPKLTVVAQQVTGGNAFNNCVSAGATIYQNVMIVNNGNMDMENLELKLQVSNSSGVVVETINETITGTLNVGDYVNYTFTNSYTVPEDNQYNVVITVNPQCNSSLSYSSTILECVAVNDIEVVGILVPADDNTCSSIGERVSVKVKVQNNNPNDDAHNVNLYAEIVDNNGTQLASWTETINTINADDYEEVEFAPFTVPSVASYTVQAYLVGNNDINPSNDTVAPVTKCTDLGIVNAMANNISMSQNIPNPAKGMTSVNYTIPEDGKVMFSIMTVTGQILYTEEVNAVSGNNRIEFNTANMASGIYFYTMTFNGLRIVKKMTIEK